MKPEPVENFRMLEALDYARRGWLVIPLHWPRISAGKLVGCSCCTRSECGSVGKHPLTENGLKDATIVADAIRRWWEKWPLANVGIVTGAASGIVVLDEDPKNGGDASYDRLRDEHGETVTTEADTGGGGVHRIYAHPGKTVRNSAGRVGKGLDVRGDGGYIVAPPSQHASGFRYAWRENRHPDDTPPAPMPDWLLRLAVDRPQPPPAQHPHSTADAGRKWLGEALARANAGNRNETGFWLACQLRDNGVSRADAVALLFHYVSRCPQGGDRPPYTDREAAQSVESAYTATPRPPAKSMNAPTTTRPAPKKVAAPAGGASGELAAHLESIIDGRVFNVPFPWPHLTKLTQALVNGCVTTVCGDPGVGKTFWTLQALQHWRGNDIPCSVFFIEKDRKFHTLRLLAQLEGKGCYVDLEWVKAHPVEVRAAMNRNAGMIDILGESIWSETHERLTVDALFGWIRDRASGGTRILVIDPITAADAGNERWRVDDEFMVRTQHVLNDHGASLVLITHPKKGNRPGAPTGHDQAGGAAYHRFADTNIWLYRPRKPRRVMIQTVMGPAQMKLELFAQIHKARHGKGAGVELGMTFGEGLKFAEQGVVLKDVPEEAAEAA